MTHLDEGTIQAWLHEALPSSARADAATHLAQCAACQSLVEQARRDDQWVLERMAVLDTPAPHPELGRVRQMSRVRASSQTVRRAATILVVVGGASLAWALTPVRELARRVLAPSAESVVSTPPAAPTPTPERGEPSSGIAVVPGARFAIDFESVQAAGSVRIRLSDRVDISIEAHGERIALESREGSVVVRNRGSSANYDVEIPRAAAEVEVRAAGRRIWLKRAAEIQTPGALGAGGWYAIDLRSPE
jgi:hypothetical protein